MSSLPHGYSFRTSHPRTHSDHPLGFEVVFTACNPLVLTGPPWERDKANLKCIPASLSERTTSGNIFLIPRIHSFHLPQQSSSSDLSREFEVDFATQLGIPLLNRPQISSTHLPTSGEREINSLMSQPSNAPSSKPFLLASAL